jgi:cytoskeletal protein CcmA (bactofilin family)
MLRRTASIFLAILFLLLIPLTALAATFIFDEDRRTVTEPVEDDVYIIANAVDIQAPIARNLFAIGENVTIQDSIGVNAYVLANNARITGDVAGDLFVAASAVEITDEATIANEAYVAAQDVTINGNIGGTIRVRAGSVTVSPNAVINGDLIVSGPEPTIAEGATITGTLRHEPVEPEPRDAIASWVRQVIMLFVIALLLLYVLPPFTRSVLATASSKPLKLMLIAFIWLLLIIPVTVILMITIVGIPLALAMLFLTAVFYILSTGYAAILIGSWVMSKIAPGEVDWPHALLGAVIYQGVQFLLGPFGWILTFIVVLLAFGALAQTFRLYIQHGYHDPT